MSKTKKLVLKRRRIPSELKRAKSHSPPDPEQKNDMRAATANVAIVAFRKAYSVERENASGDVLASLKHLCDRDPSFGDFDDSLKSAYRHYTEETATDAEYARM